MVCRGCSAVVACLGCTLGIWVLVRCAGDPLGGSGAQGSEPHHEEQLPTPAPCGAPPDPGVQAREVGVLLGCRAVPRRLPEGGRWLRVSRAAL